MDKIIHSTAIVNGELSAAFAMFTQSSKITMWLAMGAEVEPFVGGRYELFWDMNNSPGCAYHGHTSGAFRLGR